MRKRLPVAGAYNTRSSSVNSLSSTSGVVGIGIVGSMIVGQSVRGSDKDVRFINCLIITVSDAISQSKRLRLVKRPGFVTSTTPAAGEKGYAIHVWLGQGAGNKVITGFGATNSTIYDGTSSLGAITGRVSGITETKISGTATLAISSGDGTGWWYQPSGSLTQISDGDFPGNVPSKVIAGTFAHMDGYAFIMDTLGKIWDSDLNSITSWTATSSIQANSIPDIGVGVVRHRNTIIGFCKEHFDVFRNAGNATGSPLSRIDELSQLIGCISADAITLIRDKVYFAGTSKEANIAIYAYDGGAVEKVSTPEQEAQFIIAGPANITLTAMGFYGRHFVIVMASNTTFVYCVEEKNWHEWSSLTPLWYKADGLSAGSSMVNYAISNLSTGGRVLVFNPASITYQDVGNPYTATWQTGRVDFGTSLYKFWSFMSLICDKEDTTSLLYITPYDDDYTTPGTTYVVDLSSNDPRVHIGGRSRRRSYTLSHAANTPMGIEALEPEFEMGTT